MKPSELLSDKTKWTKWVSARSATQKAVEPDDEKAVCWCVIGAINKCYGYGSEYNRAIGALRDIIRKKYGLFGIASWQDLRDTTFEQVKEVLKEAGE